MADYPSRYDGQEIDDLLDLVHDRVSTPIAGSDKPITAGGVKIALDSKANSSDLGGLTNTVGGINTRVTAIEGKIPSAASGGNQLADKNYVDTGLNGKVDKVTGKGLSTNDYTNTEKAKLAALPTNATLTNLLNNKQDVIADLATIRSGAAAGATAYQKPGTGIPKTDLASAVQTSLGKADSAYQKPGTGIPGTDLASAVQTSLGKADSAYQKPGSGIPKTDLDSAVQASLDKADAAAPQGTTYTKTEVDTALATKVDKVEGKGLSTEDYTSEEKEKLGALPANAALQAEFNTKADKDGAYNELGAGSAKDLEGTVVQSAEYTKCALSGIHSGLAQLDKLNGNTIVLNQLVNGAFYNLTGWAMGSGTNPTYSGGVVTMEKIGVICMLKAQNFNTAKGHKYYYASTLALLNNGEANDAVISVSFVRSSNESVGNISTASSSKTRVSNIYTATDEVLGFCLRITPNNSQGAIGTAEDVMLIDLTQMFGAGNEPSSAAEFEDMYPLNYYVQNNGALINNGAQAIETVGFNQWDEEWEIGRYSPETGEPENGYSIRSKNRIPVLPNTEYYLNKGASGQGIYAVFFYDADGDFISSVANVQASAITPFNAAYMNFCSYNDYGVTYKNDICINLSDVSKNGTYRSYEKHTLQLGLDSFDVTDGTNVITVNGLKSAGSVSDEIDLVRQKYIKRVGTVDLGSLTWNKPSTYANLPRANAVITDSVGSATVAKFICSKYIFSSNVTDSSTATDKTAKLYINKNFYVVDSALDGMTSEQVKSAMSGVMLYYELATPVEYDLVNPIVRNIVVNENGTIQRLPADTSSTILAPFSCDVRYPIGAAETIASLPKDYISTESIDQFLTALGTQMGGTWTRTWDASNNSYNFTFTQN